MRWRSKSRSTTILVSNILQTAQNATQPFLYTFNDRKNIWNNRLNDRGNSEELFAVQYQLGASSTLFSNPPREFLGSDRSQIDYPTTYQKLKELFIDTETFEAAQTALKEDDFVAISYTTYGEGRARKQRVVYVRTKVMTRRIAAVSMKASNLVGCWHQVQRAIAPKTVFR